MIEQDELLRVCLWNVKDTVGARKVLLASLSSTPNFTLFSCVGSLRTSFQLLPLVPAASRYRPPDTSRETRGKNYGTLYPPNAVFTLHWILALTVLLLRADAEG